jgi:hypothetical protein
LDVLVNEIKNIPKNAEKQVYFYKKSSYAFSFLISFL